LQQFLCFLQSLCSCGLVNELQQMMDNDQLDLTTCGYFSVLENKILSHVRLSVTPIQRHAICFFRFISNLIIPSMKPKKIPTWNLLSWHNALTILGQHWKDKKLVLCHIWFIKAFIPFMSNSCHLQFWLGYNYINWTFGQWFGDMWHIHKVQG
jgi:hypothetical protein